MTIHDWSETNPVSNTIQSLAAAIEAAIELAILMQRTMADAASELSEALDRLQNNHPAAAGMKPKYPPMRRQTCRKASSALSQKEQQAWASVHVQGKTITQTAIEFSCTPQNISKHLNNAQRKIKAQQSRSANTSHRLPKDNRGQVTAF
jgi:DNA-binding CsgD family transcriptional regulator